VFNVSQKVKHAAFPQKLNRFFVAELNA